MVLLSKVDRPLASILFTAELLTTSPDYELGFTRLGG